MNKKYQVIVGNIGTMEYTSRKQALECYETYREMSIANIGRSAGESVTILEDGEIINEHIGELEQDY